MPPHVHRHRHGALSRLGLDPRGTAPFPPRRGQLPRNRGVFTICPPPAVTKWGCAATRVKNTALQFTFMIASHSASVTFVGTVDAHDPGVVDEHVQPLPGVDRRVDGSAPILRGADVSVHGQAVPSGRGERLRRFRGGGFISVSDHHGGAVACQPLRRASFAT